MTYTVLQLKTHQYLSSWMVARMIEGVMRDFLWSGTCDWRKDHLVVWDKVYRFSSAHGHSKKIRPSSYHVGCLCMLEEVPLMPALSFLLSLLRLGWEIGCYFGKTPNLAGNLFQWWFPAFTVSPHSKICQFITSILLKAPWFLGTYISYTMLMEERLMSLPRFSIYLIPQLMSCVWEKGGRLVEMLLGLCPVRFAKKFLCSLTAVRDQSALVDSVDDSFWGWLYYLWGGELVDWELVQTECR